MHAIDTVRLLYFPEGRHEDKIPLLPGNDRLFQKGIQKEDMCKQLKKSTFPVYNVE
jgi:hypothetical protein